MAATKKQPPPEEPPGAPEWMLTFSDCMTLLLTFFVLLMTFSSPGNSDVKGVSDVIARLLPGFDWSTERYHDSLVEYLQFQAAEGTETGSEKPTLQKGTKGGLKATTPAFDLEFVKVFSIQSEKVFFGRGSVISPEGRDIMTTIASFLSRVPNRVAICEYGFKNNNDSDEIGLQRAWALMEHLTTKHRLNKKRFSISGASSGIATEAGLEGSSSAQPGMENERVLEIIVLDRSSYD